MKDDSDAVVVECDLPDPPQKVWRALTEANLLAAWLMPNDLRPEVGARFQLRPQRSEGRKPPGHSGQQDGSTGAGCSEGPGTLIDGAAPVECEVLQAKFACVLRWRQSERDVEGGTLVRSIVTFELSDIPNGGTHLRVVHDGFERVAEGVAATRARAEVVELRTRRLRARSAVSRAVPLLLSLRRAA